MDVDDDLRSIIVINSRILEDLKAQKARSLKLLNKYKLRIEAESSLPVNSYLPWTKHVDPFIDQVITTHQLDYQIARKQEDFIRQLQEYILSGKAAVGTEDLEDLLEFVCDLLVGLEHKYKHVFSVGKAFAMKPNNNLTLPDWTNMRATFLDGEHEVYKVGKKARTEIEKAEIEHHIASGAEKVSSEIDKALDVLNEEEDQSEMEFGVGENPDDD